MADVSEHDHVPTPIALQRCRELLGEEAIDLSDGEVDEVRRYAQVMAHLLIELAEAEASALSNDDDMRPLQCSDVGFMLRSMLGAVIYIRVSA